MVLRNLNKKLGKKVLQFNLPRHTCEAFRTPICDKYCYAKHAAFTFPSTQAAMRRNYEESLLKDFADIIIEQLRQKRVKYVRLHPSGDFYSEEYYEKWVQIAKRSPRVRFMAFTRNPYIDFSMAPANLKIYFSIDQTTEKVNNTVQLQAILRPYNGDWAAVKHMQRFENGFACASKCKSCKSCWYAKFNVVFVQRWHWRNCYKDGKKRKRLSTRSSDIKDCRLRGGGTPSSPLAKKTALPAPNHGAK